MLNTEQLDQFIQELAKTHASLNQASNDGPLFVLARLVPNMDKAVWKKLGKEAAKSGWCALEMQSSPLTVHAPLMPATLKANIEDNLSTSLLAASFMQHLDMEVSRAVRSNGPLALVHFALENEEKSLLDSTQILQKAVHTYGGPCDILGAIGKLHLALILPGAKIFKAQNIVEDIIDFCAKEKLSLQAGIAGNVGKACDSHILFEQAGLALQSACTQGQNVRVFQEQTINLDATLVHSHEKRFLFGG